MTEKYGLSGDKRIVRSLGARKKGFIPISEMKSGKVIEVREEQCEKA
jgi:hypothetical protein